MSANRVQATRVSASRCTAASAAPASRGGTSLPEGWAGKPEPVMVRRQGTAKVQPVRAGQDTGNYLAAIVAAARRCSGRDPPPGHGSNRRARRRCRAGRRALSPGWPGRVVPACRARSAVPRRCRRAVPGCQPASWCRSPAKRAADVLVSGQPALSVRCRAALLPFRASAAGRGPAGRHGEPLCGHRARRARARCQGAVVCPGAAVMLGVRRASPRRCERRYPGAWRNRSLLIRSAACNAHAVRPVQPVTTSMARPPQTWRR